MSINAREPEAHYEREQVTALMECGLRPGSVLQFQQLATFCKYIEFR